MGKDLLEGGPEVKKPIIEENQVIYPTVIGRARAQRPLPRGVDPDHLTHITTQLEDIPKLHPELPPLPPPAKKGK